MYTSQYIRVERIDSSHRELSPARPSANAAACCALPQEGVGHGGSWHVNVLQLAPLKTTRKMYILGRSQGTPKNQKRSWGCDSVLIVFSGVEVTTTISKSSVPVIF